MKRIVLTGGGTAGHVTPIIALLPELIKSGYDIHYIGSYDGIEKALIEDCDIPYYGISSGKLRRYFSVKNFTDPFRVIKGFFQARKLIKTLKPDIIFSKGGFITVPVVLAARTKNIPSIIHESDITPGLANKIVIPSAKKVCANFPETMRYLPEDKSVLTGTPIRDELFAGNKLKGLEFASLSSNKPVILIMGGSSGAVAINDAIAESLDELLINYQVIHLCGKGNLNKELLNVPGYVQFEYINKGLSDLFAASDLIISRAGANAICEFVALKKPNILIPLPQGSSRGDQILNAKSFEFQGYSYLLPQEDLNSKSLLNAVDHVNKEKQKYINNMNQSKLNDSISTIVNLLKENQLNK